MSTPYSVKSESLASIRRNVQLIGTGTVVSAFAVLEFPPATTAFLKLGQSGDPIPLSDGLYGEELCETDGLWLDVPVVGAGNLVIAILTDAGGGSVGTAT